MTMFCDICQISFINEDTLEKHVSSKSHVMKVITKQIEVKVELDDLLIVLEENAVNFETQLKYFLKEVTPHVENNISYKRICSRLRNLLRKSFPMCTLQQIGSTLTGLCLKNDHLKIYVNTGEISDSLTFKKLFLTAKSLMFRKVYYYSDVKLFSRVPKIKFVDKQTNISCELHFSNGFSVYNSYLIKHYMSMDKRLKPLMMIIKYWARICTLSTEHIYMFKSSGLFITTYALVMLFIFYLQQPSVDLVPSMIKLQGNKPKVIDKWQVNFNESIKYPSAKNKTPITQLLSGFFKFYANFDFENYVICPIDGCAHPKASFKNINNLPDSMNRYKEYIEDTKDALTLDVEKPLCIQDPIELNRNCSDNLSTLFLKSFQEYVFITAQICNESLQKDSRKFILNLFKRIPKEKNSPDHLRITVKNLSLDNERKSVKNKSKIAKSYLGGSKKLKKRLIRNLVLNTSFEKQLALFLSEVTLTDYVVKTCYEPVCEKLNQLFRQSFPMCQIHQLGSTVTGLCFKKSNLDVHLNIVETMSSNEKNALPSVLTFRKISAIALMQLLESSNSYREITLLLKTKTPIIKFTDREAKISCDLSFKNSLALHNTHLIKHYLSFDTRLESLIMIIKFWAKLCDFQTANITNYAVVMLCIFYLQQPEDNLVPPVIDIKKHCDPEIVDGWQVNFNEKIIHPSLNYKSIPELLHGFFNFYEFFDFDEFVICPVDGCAHSKEMFKNVNTLPESMNRYVEYMKNTENAIPLGVEKTFCLQDPTELNVNCTFNTPNNYLKIFRTHVSNAAEVCRTALQNDCSNLLLNLFETVRFFPNNKEKKRTRNILSGDSSS